MLQASRFKAFEQVIKHLSTPQPRTMTIDQVFGRPVTGLWAALHLLLKLLPDHATDVLGYLSRVGALSNSNSKSQHNPCFSRCESRSAVRRSPK